MTLTTIFFFFLAHLYVFFQSSLQTLKNILYFIIIIFLTCLFGLFTTGAEFIFLVYLMIYISATSVLFLFAVVVVNPKEENAGTDYTLSVSCCLLIDVVLALFFMFFPASSRPEEGLTAVAHIIDSESAVHNLVLGNAPEMSNLASLFYNHSSELVVAGGFFLTVTLLSVSLINKKL